VLTGSSVGAAREVLRRYARLLGDAGLRDDTEPQTQLDVLWEQARPAATELLRPGLPPAVTSFLAGQ